MTIIAVAHCRVLCARCENLIKPSDIVNVTFGILTHRFYCIGNNDSKIVEIHEKKLLKN